MKKRPTRDAILNCALLACVATWPDKERLAKYVSDNELTDQKMAIEVEVNSVVSRTESYLYSQERGVKWSEDFEKQFFKYLTEHHPWLSQQGFSRLMGFSKWLCWHEGLNA